MADSWMIYGANGYTGELVAREAARRGLKPVLSGRSADRIEPLARELGLDWRAFELGTSEQAAAGLAGVGAVLHCAGPFYRTYHAMVEGCLAQRVHYLDITGEIPVFEAVASRDQAARKSGITLLPGVGFDVVPSDCLAAHLKRRLPGAVRLALAFGGSGGVSRGTLRTALEQADAGSAVRRDGRLVPIPAGSLRREVDFGRGAVGAVAIPWGDLSTAWRSTGIGNLETYMALPSSMALGLKLLRLVAPLARTRLYRAALDFWLAGRAPGPDAADRARGRSWLWGEAVDASGHRVVTRQSGPEGYALTIETALLAMAKVLSGEAPVGYCTPASAFGPDLILEIPGVTRRDE